MLSKQNFPYVNYNYVGKVLTPIRKTPGWEGYEILQYDILDLNLTPEHTQELIKLLEEGVSKYIKWASAELIQCLGQDELEKRMLYDIGQHTKWVLNMKWFKV